MIFASSKAERADEGSEFFLTALYSAPYALSGAFTILKKKLLLLQLVHVPAFLYTFLPTQILFQNYSTYTVFTVRHPIYHTAHTCEANYDANHCQQAMHAI